MKSMMSKTYRVVWEIDVDANDPLAAAKEAVRIQHDNDSAATFYVVHSPEGHVSAYSDNVLHPTQLSNVAAAEKAVAAIIRLK